MSIPEIEAVLRDDLPEPDPAFARELDRRVADGFPRKRWVWKPVMAAAATVTAGIVAVVALSGGHEATAPLPQAKSPAGVSALTASPSAPRKIERSINMTLAIAHGKLAQAAADVGRIATARGGYVAASNVSTGSGSEQSGDFTLRVPTASVEQTLADLSGLGDVRERTETSNDVTASFNHVEDSLANALLERRNLRDRLASATGDERARLRAQLREIDFQVRRLTTQMRLLRRQTSMSTVQVTLEEKQPKSHGGVFGGGPGAALDDALGVVSGALNLAIRALPLILLAGLAWWGAAAARRRRREAALF
jgi:hypothetical protein